MEHLWLMPVLAAAKQDESGYGVWIFLAVVIVGVALAFRAINKASLRRLEGGSPETVKDIKRKRAERKSRKEEAEAEAEAAATAKEKPKKGKKAKKTAPEPAPEPKVEEKDDGLLLPPGKTLNEGLSKTRSDGFIGRLGKLFKGKQIDESLLGEVEEVLFTADIGVRTADKLIDGLRKGLKANELGDEKKAWSFLRSRSAELLESAGEANSLARQHTPGKPYVLLVIGVNGAGKTTTIGKLAHRLIADGKKVLIGAGDTFRAAAVDQLAVWAKRVGAEIVEGAEGADPSSVLFDAVKRAEEENFDVVLLDTAGRLHTNVNLVKELQKVGRVIGKALDGAPHEVLLVLDGTTGQNAIAQAHTFTEAMGVSGIVLTKIDGTAKGGVILGIADELQLPIAWVGIGERTEDLRPFHAGEFVDALFGGPDA